MKYLVHWLLVNTFFERLLKYVRSTKFCMPTDESFGPQNSTRSGATVPSDGLNFLLCMIASVLTRLATLGNMWQMVFGEMLEWGFK